MVKMEVSVWHTGGGKNMELTLVVVVVVVVVLGQQHIVGEVRLLGDTCEVQMSEGRVYTRVNKNPSA